MTPVFLKKKVMTDTDKNREINKWPNKKGSALEKKNIHRAHTHIKLDIFFKGFL